LPETLAPPSLLEPEDEGTVDAGALHAAAIAPLTVITIAPMKPRARISNDLLRTRGGPIS
jgi:hypothetical protein